jgi:hypothetical protein
MQLLRMIVAKNDYFPQRSALFLIVSDSVFVLCLIFVSKNQSANELVAVSDYTGDIHEQ